MKQSQLSNKNLINSTSERLEIIKNDFTSEEGGALKPKDSKKKNMSMSELDDEDEKYAQKELNDSEDVKTETSFRQRFDASLTNGKFINIISFISFIFAIFIYLGYIVTTYFPLNTFLWFDIINVVIATFYNLETFLYVYLAQHRLIYLLSLQNLIELFTSIYPYFFKFNNKINLKILEISRSCYIFRISKYLNNNIKINENEVVKCIINVIISFAVIIFFFASIFRITELDELEYLIINPENRVYSLNTQTSFHEFIYYTVITLSTVGYGDIYPISETSRIVIICLIILAAYMIPLKTGDLLALLKDTSIYSREIYKSNPEIPHIVVCGYISVDAMISFCQELFHVDHGQTEKNVIILDKNKPCQEMKMFLHAGKYEMNVKYLEGNPMNEKDLERAAITKAKLIVILTDKYSLNPNPIDFKNILLALNIKKYFLKKNIENSTIYLQLIKPENKIHYLNGLETFASNNKISQDRMIIIEEIKMNLLSKSCLIPGIIPFISNLIRSSGSSQETEFIWLNEYLEGIEQEIYRTELNESFKNQTFAQISKIIYKNYDAIAFALEIEIDGKTTIYLNPGGFYIEKFLDKRDDIKYFIYVICSDKEVANQISKADLNKEINADGESDEESDGEDNEIMTILNNKNNDKTKVKKTKFHQYMRLQLKDILQLENNSLYNYYFRDEEDDYFFVKSKTWAPPDVKKDSIRNSSKYKDHIVVCGTHPALYYYLLPLRAKYFGKKNLKYVVILTQNMPKNLWDSIARFEKIILINGSPLNIEDLYRANIEYASKVIILENNKNRENSFSDKMVDNERIFIYKAIKKCNPNIQIMTELIYESNIEYLLDQDELSTLKPNNVSYNLTSVFSSGEVYINSIIDSLTAQAYYNKHIVTIIHQLLAGGKNTGNSTIRKICEDIGLKSSNFWQTDIPEKFINKTFGELYDEFCENNLVILGLYRLHGARDNNTGYIYTKPCAETKITHRDKVFVLAENSELEAYFKEDNNKEVNENEEELGREKEGFSANFNFDIDEKNNQNQENDGEEEGNRKFSPFNYFRDKISEIEKEVNKMSNIIDNTRSTIKESISSGVKQEIISLLQ